MALPKQVEAQLRELEQIEKQIAESQNQAPDNPELTENPPAEPSTPEPPAEEQKPVEPKPEPTEPVIAEETWQSRYIALKGKYDAEVPRLHADVREFKSQLDSLRKVVETKPVETKKPAVAEKLVTDADVQAFGEDLIEVQRKVAREVASEFRSELDAMRAENEQLREQLTTTGTQVSEASFEQRLYRMVPDFQEVNADPRWIEWLNEVDPLLRAPRKTVAQNAFNEADAEAVAHYVGMFKSGISPVVQNNDKAAELEKQIQPKRSATNSANVSQQAQTYTDAQIHQMFLKSADFSAKGRTEEAMKLEAEIDAAYREGRVRA
jgi:heterodisulfide reductase subunit C